MSPIVLPGGKNAFCCAAAAAGCCKELSLRRGDATRVAHDDLSAVDQQRLRLAQQVHLRHRRGELLRHARLVKRECLPRARRAAVTRDRLVALESVAR